MAYNLQTFGRFDARLGDAPVHAGSLEKPSQLSVAGKEYKFATVVNSNTNTLIYNDNLGAFVFLWFQSTRTVTIQLTTSGTNTESLKIEVPGSSDNIAYGIPFILGSDDTYDADPVAARIATVRCFNEDVTSGNDASVLIHVIL
jgi:hypothetical protein